jgi:hypothetical protein
MSKAFLIVEIRPASKRCGTMRTLLHVPPALINVRMIMA